MDMASTPRADDVAQPRRPRGPRWYARSPFAVRLAIRVVLGLFLVLALAWLVLYITKGRFLKHPFENLATSLLERKVTVGGDFNLYFDPLDIHFKAGNLDIANPEWAKQKSFFGAKLIDTRIHTFPLIFGRREVEWIALDQASLAPEWDAKHQRNSWTFGDPNQQGAPLQLPHIERGIITHTAVVYSDPLMQFATKIGIDTVKAQDTRFENEIRFSGSGSMRAKPFTLSGRLLNPNQAVAGGKTELTLHADAARTVFDVSGTLPAPTQIEGSNLVTRVHGRDIADLFNFIGVAVPPTRDYHIDSDLTYADSVWRFTHLRGLFGDSDIGGTLKIAMPDQRVKLTADLATTNLDIVDAGPFIGYDPDALAKGGAKAAVVQTARGHPRILPDAPLRMDAISQFDADVRYKVTRIKAKDVPVSNIDLTLGLDHSLLTLKPLKALIAGGQLTSNITLDARQPLVVTDYDIHLAPTPMGKLLARFGVVESGTTGTLSARIKMRGVGNSVRASLASSNGRMAIILPTGTMWARNIQLIELDLGVFLQKLLEKKLKDPVDINCGLIAFTVRDGIAAADPILIDTKKNVVLGRGGFSFKDEALDLSLRADAKTFSLFSGQSPIGLAGYFAAPAVHPISGQLLTRAGVAVGAGVFLTPLASLIAFVDPGDAKATACGPVLAGLPAKYQRTDKGKPRTDVGNGTPGKSNSGQESPREQAKQRQKFLDVK
jgi:uncharacterized protein involved in outer membrane biogenesis